MSTGAALHAVLRLAAALAEVCLVSTCRVCAGLWQPVLTGAALHAGLSLMPALVEVCIAGALQPRQ